MQATIFLTNLSLRVHIGVRPRERRVRQPIRIDVALEAELPGLAGGDDLSLTINYSALHDRIVAFVEASAFALIETLARGVGALCLEDTRVAGVEVTVRKPRALPRADAAGVTIRMARNG